MDERESYAAAWTRMRRLIVANVAFLVAWAAGGAALLVEAATATRAAILVPLAVVDASLLVAFLVANVRMRQWRCPRCHQLWIPGTGFTSRCTKCKPPWGATSPSG